MRRSSADVFYEEPFADALGKNMDIIDWEAIALRLAAIASRLEAIATRLAAIAALSSSTKRDLTMGLSGKLQGESQDQGRGATSCNKTC